MQAGSKAGRESCSSRCEVQMMSALRATINRIIRRIPRGRVLSYGEVARMANTGPRQVAAAMRACPEGLPWHRVVGAGGRIRTSGETAWRQRERLMLEGVRFRGSGFRYELYRWKQD